MADISINYLGEEITIREKDCLSFEIKSTFDELAEQAATTYVHKYYNSYGNFQTFASRGISDGYRFLDTYLDKAADLLVKHGVHHANRQMLKSKYGSTIFRMWATLDYYANGKYDLAQAEVEAERQAREYRKATRGRMVGGGFGIKGAVKGMTMAGTYNLASGLVHSGVNAIGNSMSRNRSQKELQNAYETDFREFSDTAIKLCIKNMGKIVADELDLDDPYEMEEYVGTLRKNFSEVAPEFLPMAVAEIIAIAPWDMDTYRLLLPRFGDPERGLYKLIHQAPQNVIIAYNEIRRGLLSPTTQAACEQVKDLVAKTPLEELTHSAFTSEKDRIRSSIEEKASWLGCNPRDNVRKRELNVFDERVTKLCQEKDELSRNVAGIVYPSRELAEKARENFQQAQALAQASKNADYRQICDNLQKLRAIDGREPSGTALDFVMEVEKLESNARTAAGIEYATYELATKANENRDMANQLIADCSKGTITKDKLLSEVYGLNQAEPKGSLTDLLDKILVQYFDRKEDTDSKMFRKVSYQTELERQTVECEFVLFLIAHPLATNTEEELIQLIDQADHDAKHAAIDPLTRTELERYWAAMREKTLKKMQNNAQKAIRAKKQAKADIYRVAFGIFSLAAMIFLPLVKVSGTSCTFIGIIQAMGNDSDLLFGGVILILTYVVFWGAIIRYILEPLQMLAMVIGFVVVVGGVCLIGGSAYNASIWLYILLGGGIAGYALGN